MPTAGRDADITLSRTDGTTNLVKIALWRDSPNLPGGWSEEHVSGLAPRVAQDDQNYQQRALEFGSVFDQDSWHRGFGQGLISVTPGHESRDRYGYTDGVMAMFPNELIPSYQEDEVDILVRNGRFETGATSPWSGTNTTLAISTSERSGSYAVQVTVNANNGTMSDTYQASVTPLRSREFNIHAFALRESGTGTCAARITDSAGSTTGTAVSGTDWTYLTATRTLGAAATTLAWEFVFSTSGDVWRIDDISVIPTGGVNFPTEGQEFGGSYYVPCGRCILKWDEDNDYFAAVEVDSAYVFTSLVSYAGALYAGRGSSANYRRSTDGTTWADPATNSGNSRLATHFVRGLNANGDPALFKSRANQVSVTTDPSDTANWGSEIQTGDTDRTTNKLIASGDVVYVGREDGLLVYDGIRNRFKDIEPEANFFPDVDNFDAALGRAGSLIVSGGLQTVWRVTPQGGTHAWEDLTHLFQAETFRGFGGQVTALAQDRSGVWVALADNRASSHAEFPYTFPFSFASQGASSKIYILSLRRSEDGQQDVVHTVSGLATSRVNNLGRFADPDNSISSLFALGSLTNTSISLTDTSEPRVIRLRIPLINDNPRHNSTVAVRRSGAFYSPWIDFNYPDTQKAQARLTITSRNLSATKYWTVSYKLDDASDDDASGWTVWGSTGVFNTSPAQTVSAVLTTLVTFNRIRFKFEFTSDSNSDAPPLISAVVLDVAANPIDFHIWRGVTRLTDHRAHQLRRVPQVSLKAADIASLDALHTQPFIQMTDPDGTARRVRFRYKTTRLSVRTDSLRGRTLDDTRLIEMEFTEVKVS